MTSYLLDANVLIALTVAEHEHHDRASRWVSGVGTFALCPIVEGALVRFLVRLGESAATAQSVLAALHAHDKTEIWTDRLSYAEIDLSSVRGHRQVTDAYLVALARSNDGQLATLDRGLADQHHDATLLLPP